MSRIVYLLAAVVIAGLVALNLAQYREASVPAGRAEVIEAFVKLWSREMGFLMKDSRWLGVRTLQNPMDVWVTQEILFEQKPDFVVETGTYEGGSALLWATVLAQVNPRAQVITVDIKNLVKKARRHPLWKQKVEFLLGSSTAPEIVSAIEQRVAGKRVVVILDSLHTREHVFDELVAYSRFVPKGGYLIVQDTGIWQPKSSTVSGAADAIQDFLKTTDAFDVDRTRERYILTSNAKGFLKRVK